MQRYCKGCFDRCDSVLVATINGIGKEVECASSLVSRHVERSLSAYGPFAAARVAIDRLLREQRVSTRIAAGEPVFFVLVSRRVYDRVC